MSTVLSPSSLNKPANPDTGLTFWNDLAAAIQRLNDHTHAGTGDASLLGKTQAIAAGSYTTVSATQGIYTKTITMNSGLTFDGVMIQIRLTSTGEIIYPKIVKASSTSFTITMSDTTLALTAVYI